MSPSSERTVAPRRKSQRSDAFKTFGLPALLVLAGFLVAWQFVDPAPPSRLVLAAGQPGGAYASFAARYAERLADHGVEVEILETRGSVDNLERLNAREADVAFVQGGTAGRYRDTGLVSLGSVYFEPLWVFHQGETPLETLAGLTGRRVAVGPPGSGTRALALNLLGSNGLLDHGVEAVEIGGAEAAEALRSGEIDALFGVAGPSSPLVQSLARDPALALMHFRRASAYSRRHDYLSELLLPEGVIDLSANVPARDIHLLAAAANLVAHPDVHPALLDLLLQAARQVHGSGDWFAERERFPAPENLVLPLSPDAQRFYEHGPPFLQRYLPFWAATWVERLKVMLLPLVMLLFPLAKVMPPVYTWRMRSRVYRWYQRVDDLEANAHHARDPQERAALLEELDRVEQEVADIHVPLSFMSQVYDLRMHLDMVRRRLREGQPASPADPDSAGPA